MQDSESPSRRLEGETSMTEREDEMDRDEDEEDEEDEDNENSGGGGVGQLMDREKILSRALCIVSKKMQNNFQCSFHVGLMHFRNQNYPKAKEASLHNFLQTDSSKIPLNIFCANFRPNATSRNGSN